MSTLILARLQFAFTIAFHYLYPPLSIGLGIVMVVIEALWLITQNPVYHQMARFWTKVFALTFAIGVATGIVMEFEFGTNWATYSRYVGDIFGSALAAEGIFAFFLESGFLAVLLFGWDRVGRGLHFFSTCMVALGAHFSAIWIVVANSWMQTPAGYHIIGEGLTAKAQVTDFWAMVFNPSSMVRLAHTLAGCWAAAAWLVVSVAAYYMLTKRHRQFAHETMRVGLVLGLVSIGLTFLSGDSNAKMVAHYQPEKLAAYEGLWHTQPKAPMYIMGAVDDKKEETRGLQVPVPGLLSWLTYGDVNKPVTGLKEFKPEDRPPVNITFQFYHLMIAVGVALLFLSLWANAVFWWGKIENATFLLWCLVLSVLGPQIANQVGWYATEVGRQPWIVYHLLRTSDALSKVVRANQIVASMVMFMIVYALLFAVFVFLLNDKIQHGPDEADLEKQHGKHTLAPWKIR